MTSSPGLTAPVLIFKEPIITPLLIHNYYGALGPWDVRVTLADNGLWGGASFLG